MSAIPPLIGIDLGTTNSVAAVWRDGTAQLIPNALGEVLTPSVVSLDDDGQVLVGRAAAERLLSHPEQSVAAFKRRMGSNHEARLGPRRLRPEELSALVLRQLLDDARQHLDADIEEAVISVPAYFNDAQRRATKHAGELAGIRVERLINEPTAAAIAYGLHEALDDARILVVDLGGGTLDVSVLEFFEGIMEVHATAGDNYLGGEDFEDLLASTFLAEHKLEPGALGSGERAALRRSVQRAKHALSSGTEAAISLQRKRLLGSPVTLEWTINREAFEQLAAPLLTRLQRTIERAVRDGKLQPDELDQIVMVGGATRMPMVRKLVGRLFRRMPMTHINPDEIVALGAAVQAGLKSRDAALDDVVLTDVCPYTLGVNIAIEKLPDQYESGHFLPIIERNTTVPVSRVERVFPLHPDQKTLVCDIYQGEARRVQNNVKLGSVSIDMPPDTPADGADVRFTYDVNGILEVLLEVVASGAHKRLVITSSDSGLSADEIEASLAKLAGLKIHPREQLANRTALARGERLYEEQLGPRRQMVARLIAQFEQALESQDTDLIESARSAFEAHMDELEVDVFR